MDRTPNRAERWLPMDFLRTNTKLLYLLPLDQRKDVYSSNAPLVFRQWNNSLLLEAIDWCKTKPISTACYNWISVSHRTIDQHLSHMGLSFWNILPLATAHPTRPFFCYDKKRIFIRREFDVYGRKLINNVVHSLRHSLHSLILVMFVMYLKHKNIKHTQIRPTSCAFFLALCRWDNSQSALLLFQFFCL